MTKKIDLSEVKWLVGILFTLGGFALGGGQVRVNSLTGLGIGGYCKAKESLTGVSIGILNYTRHLNGVQIGLLNYCRNNPRGLRLLPIINVHFD